MKMRYGLVVWLFLAIALPHADADFYRYVDEHGNVLYTDDLSKVPVEQRDKAQSYEDSQSPAPPAVKEAKTEGSQLDPSPTVGGNLENERQSIQAREKALNDEYNSLMKERNALDQEKQDAVTPDQIKAYNQKIVEFNARIQAYEEKRAVYADQVAAFNEKLKSGQQESQNP